jgi:hypothetical protein
VVVVVAPLVLAAPAAVAPDVASAVAPAESPLVLAEDAVEAPGGTEAEAEEEAEEVVVEVVVLLPELAIVGKLKFITGKRRENGFSTIFR